MMKHKTPSSKKQAYWKTSYLTAKSESWNGQVIQANYLSPVTLQVIPLDERTDRQKIKMGWEHHWVNWKILLRESNIGTQLRYMEGANQVLTCAVILWPYLIMVLVQGYKFGVPCKDLIYFSTAMGCKTSSQLYAWQNNKIYIYSICYYIEVSSEYITHYTEWS